MTLLRILCQIVALPLIPVRLSVGFGGTNEAEKETWR